MAYGKGKAGSTGRKECAYSRHAVQARPEVILRTRQPCVPKGNVTMNSRNKPGVAFWASVALVVALMVYPLSWGPVLWSCALLGEPPWVDERHDVGAPA